MKKLIIMIVALAIVMVGLIPSANAALISVVWEDTVDSATNDNVIIPAPGTYDISLMVSGIVSDDDSIFELQFDVVAPEGFEFSPTISTELSYGPAIMGWVIKMGGAVEDQLNIYREFSAEFGSSLNPLQNGLLVSGITLTIPESCFLPGVTRSLKFGEAQGDYAQFLKFADMKVTCVPIPGAMLLLGSGLLGLGLMGIGKRRMRKS